MIRSACMLAPLLILTTTTGTAVAKGRPDPAYTACPTTVRVEGGMTTPDGWTALPGAGTGVLENVQVVARYSEQYDTPLVPDDTVEIGPGHRRSTWTIAAALDESVWMTCVYSSTGVRLARRLDGSFSSCTFDQHLEGTLWTPGAMACE